MEGLRTWIEIDRSAIRHNLSIFRSLIDKKVRLMSVVKSNAYGHGLYDFTTAIDKIGADWFGVDSLIEGLALRREGIKKPILVLGFTLPERIEEAAGNDVSITVSNFETLAVVAKRKGARRIKMHLKVDTGMHRQGFDISELPKVCKIIVEANKNGANITIEGLYTHFAAAKNPSFPHETNKQIELFNEAIKIVESFGFKPIKHASATAGTLLFPKAHYDMVRIGIGLYGMWPSKETMRALENKITLKPVMSWKTVIGEVKIVSEGGGVGYDLTEKLPKNSKIAICPIGYWHGFGRVFSSVGNVLVRGQRAKVLGRVSMDMITIDVSKVKNVKVGDEVVIIGKQVKDKITADEMAFISDGVNYEIVTRTNPLIKRILV
ncbi:MAG: alanine racemase [Candidatus Vogelbacteria bacterium]|nr:alanine racemase [Candidatus Vogelbacteria bacterium]